MDDECVFEGSPMEQYLRARPRKRSTAVKVERVDSDELLNVAIKAAIAKVEQRSPEFGPPFPRVPRQQRQSSLLSYVIESTLLGNARIEESVLESVIASQVSSDVTIESILAHVGEELQQRIIKSGLLHQKESKYYVDPDTFEDHEPNLLYPAPKKLKSLYETLAHRFLTSKKMAVALGAFLVVLALPWWALVSFLLLAGLLLQLVWRRYRNAVLFADSFSGVSSTLHSFEQSSIVLYTACRRSLRMIQEIELVSRGYKLSSPLSPITRLERNAKSRKSSALRAVLRTVLDDWFAQLLSHLPESNIDELARQSLDEGDDPLSISYLKRKLEHITLLRSRILSNFISSLQDPSFQSVGSAASVLEEFTEAIRQVTDQQQRSLQAIDAVQNDKRFIIQDGTSSSSPMTKEKRTVAKQVDDSLAKLILNLQTTIARAQLCQQNLAQLLSEPISAEEEKSAQDVNELIATIGKVKEDILESGQLWENSERSLDRFLHEQLNPVGGEPLQATAVPSGDMSEFGIEGEEGLDESSPSALLPREALERLVAENIENVYEVMKGDIEPAEGSSGKKMSREERIAQRKAKRAAAAATAPSNAGQGGIMERMAMVRELKDVLGSRFKPPEIPRGSSTLEPIEEHHQ